MLEPPTELLDYRSDPDERMVLEDWWRAHGLVPCRLGFALSFIDAYAYGCGSDVDDDADDVDSDSDDASADDDADSAAADSDDADSDDDDADAAAADSDDADATNQLARILAAEINMHDGLKIITLPGGYYGRSITRIGWLRRVAGDEWELLGACTIVRARQREHGALDRIAVEGPGETHMVSPPSKTVESVHRLIIRRALDADEIAWKDHCPRPLGWGR